MDNARNPHLSAGSIKNKQTNQNVDFFCLFVLGNYGGHCPTQSSLPRIPKAPVCGEGNASRIFSPKILAKRRTVRSDLKQLLFLHGQP